MLNEIYRVLFSGGVYICISYGVPDQRLKYFQGPKDSPFNWKITVHKLEKPNIESYLDEEDDEDDL